MRSWLCNRYSYLWAAIKIGLTVVTQLIFIGLSLIFCVLFRDALFLRYNILPILVSLGLLSLEILGYASKRLRAEGFVPSRVKEKGYRGTNTFLLSSLYSFMVVTLFLLMPFYFILKLGGVYMAAGILGIYSHAKLLMYYIVRENIKSNTKVSVSSIIQASHVFGTGKV